MAAELAEGGLRVVVLEEGPARGVADATGRPRDTLPRLYRDGGQIATIGRPPLDAPARAGHRRDDVRELGHLLPHAAAACSSAGAPSTASTGSRTRSSSASRRRSASPRSRRSSPARNAATIRRGAERARLVRRLPAPQRARLPRLGRVRLRLPDGRQAARRRGLPAARARGRRASSSRARGWSGSSSRTAARAACWRGPPAARSRSRAATVVVAAGAVHTPLLLARSGLGRSPALGRNLTVHPATAVWGVFDEPVDMSRGVPQSYYVDEFADRRLHVRGRSPARRTTSRSPRRSRATRCAS